MSLSIPRVRKWTILPWLGGSPWGKVTLLPWLGGSPWGKVTLLPWLKKKAYRFEWKSGGIWRLGMSTKIPGKEMKYSMQSYNGSRTHNVTKKKKKMWTTKNRNGRQIQWYWACCILLFSKNIAKKGIKALKLQKIRTWNIKGFEWCS